LYGDFTGSDAVNNTDLQLLKKAIAGGSSTYLWYMDYYGVGTLASSGADNDYAQFQADYGKSV
jgi:hypothetical protein